MGNRIMVGNGTIDRLDLPKVNAVRAPDRGRTVGVVGSGAEWAEGDD